jgi:hypothetical protein
VIQFAADKQRAEWFDVHPLLKKKIHVLEAIAEEIYGGIVMVTSIHRSPPIKKNDTHFLQTKPWRFVDLILPGVPTGEWEKLRTGLNIVFPYEGKAGCETFTRFDHEGTGLHWHCQQKP